MKLEHCSRASCVQIIDALSGQVTSANNNALYWYNRCQDLQEIIELFCMDAAEVHKVFVPLPSIVITTPLPDPVTGWKIS
jgi:hypothetical protein